MTETMQGPFCPQCGQGSLDAYEVQGEYDGVLIWHCPNCEYMWPRFAPPDRWHYRALEIIEQWKNPPEPEL